MSDQEHTHIYRVTGYRPLDRAVNAFLAVLDLGIDGTYFRFDVQVTLTLKADCTPQRGAEAIAAGYKVYGCRDIEVTEVIKHVTT